MWAGGTKGLAVRVIPEEKALRIQLRGPGLAGLDSGTLASCVGALAACVEANGCLDRGLSITERCFNTLVGHNLQTNCATSSFGLAPKAVSSVASHPKVELSPIGDQSGFEIRLAGEGVARINHQLVESCLNAALECAATRGCLARGLNISEGCAEALVRHNSEVGCVSRTFGVGRV